MAPQCDAAPQSDHVTTMGAPTLLFYDCLWQGVLPVCGGAVAAAVTVPDWTESRLLAAPLTGCRIVSCLQTVCSGVVFTLQVCFSNGV